MRPAALRAPGGPGRAPRARGAARARGAIRCRRSRASRRLAAACLALLLGCAPWPALALEPLRVVVVIDPTHAAHRELVEGLQNALRRNGPRAATLEMLDLLEPTHRARSGNLPAADLYVAAGTEATAELASLAPERGPILSVLVPRLSFEGLDAERAGGNPRPRSRSAIFLDQPFERQLDLIRLVLPASRRVGVALGPATSGYAAELARAGAARGLRLQPQLLAPGDNLVRELDRLLAESDALLGVVDPLVFNRANAHKILLTAYRHRVPLIGVSPAYVRAGALAAVYSTPEQIGRELGELIAQWNGTRPVELPAPRYPRYFSVTVNRQVAASLGLALAADEQLARQLGATP